MNHLTQEQYDFIEEVLCTLVPEEYQQHLHDILMNIVHFINTKEDKLHECNLNLYENSGFIELCDCSFEILSEDKPSRFGLLQKRGIYVDMVESHNGVLYFYTKGDVLQECNVQDIDKSFLFNISTIFCEHLLISLAFIICVNVIRPSYYILDMQYLIEYLNDGEYIRDENS